MVHRPHPAAGRPLQQASRTYNQIVVLRDRIIGRFAPDTNVSCNPDTDGVAPVKQLVQRLQLVVAIGPTPRHVQKQIDLGRRRPTRHRAFNAIHVIRTSPTS